MAIAHTASDDRREEILGRLIARNRVVAVLRVVVPALGILAFVALAAQIYIANMLRQYGVSGIRIDRGSIVVEAPKYSAAGSDGSHYLLTASEARSPLGKSEEIELTDATLEYRKGGGSAFFADARQAMMNTASQVAVVPGVTNIAGDDGLKGTLNALEADMGNEIIRADGAVDITLGDGTTITGSSMLHDGKANVWTFTDATVVMQDLPEAEE